MKRLSIVFLLLLLVTGLIYSNSFATENKTKIIIIDVTDKDINQYGSFPWPRDIHGRAVRILNHHKAKGVLFDMVFSEADDRRPEKDQEFAQAISDSAIPVFIPFFFVKPGGGKQAFPYPVQTLSVTNNSNIKSLEYDVLPSLHQFIASSSGTGFVNIFPNKKGILESITTVLSWNKKYYPFIAITIAAHYLKIPTNEIYIKKNIMYIGSKRLKLSNEAGFRPDFGKPFMRYKHYAYSDLLEDRIDNILGKFAIIAFNATGLSDFAVTRTSNHYPGSEINAVFIDYMLNDL